MSGRRSDTRERMVDSAVVIMREHGATATTLDEVLAHSAAPRGSVYHHFPGGRTQLVGEALERAGDSVAELIRATGESATPVQTLDAFARGWRAQLVDSGFRAGCPVLAVAIEANDGAPELSAAAARCFDSWRSSLADVLRRNGATSAHARRLATLVVAAIEGAVVLSRASRSSQPLDDVVKELRPLLAAVSTR